MPPEDKPVPSQLYDPAMAPRTIEGRPVRPFYYDNQSPTELGFFTGSALEAGTAWLDTRQRWSSIFDTDAEVPTVEQRQEMIGDRTIDLPLGLSRSEIERRLEWFDRQQYAAKYETSWYAGLAGGLAGGMLDPVNVATLPVGGANMARAAVATTFGQFVKQSAIAGAKVAAATAPLEFAVQTKTRDGVDLAEVGIATAVGALAPGILSGFALGARRAFRGLRNQAQVREIIENPAAPRDNPATIDEAITRRPSDIDAPPIRQATVDTPPPKARLDEKFDGYPGGWQQFVLDATNDAPQAQEAFQRLTGAGIDHEAFRAYLSDVASVTADSRVRSPQELTQLHDALQAQRGGTATPEQAARLRKANMVDDAGNIDPDFEAVGVNGNATNKFFRDGPEAEWRKKTRRANKQVKEWDRRIAEAQAEGKVTPRMLSDATRARVRLRKLLDQGRVVAIDQMNPEELMQVIEQVRMQFSAGPEIAARATPLEPDALGKAEGMTQGPDPLMDDVRKLARENGVPDEILDTVKRSMDEVMSNMTKCRGA